jgi:hypothetical protein
MIHEHSSILILQEAIGKTITKIYFDVDLYDAEALRFEMLDGTSFGIVDIGQSCCESRYMVCDDNLAAFAGAILLGVNLGSASKVEEEWNTHEIQFLNVVTNRGVFSVASHNKHNGYYGGFYIQIVP